MVNRENMAFSLKVHFEKQLPNCYAPTLAQAELLPLVPGYVAGCFEQKRDIKKKFLREELPFTLLEVGCTGSLMQVKVSG